VIVFTGKVNVIALCQDFRTFIVYTSNYKVPSLQHLGPNLQNILRYLISYDYVKFVVRSTYDSGLQRAKIYLRNIVS